MSNLRRIPSTINTSEGNDPLTRRTHKSTVQQLEDCLKNSLVSSSTQKSFTNDIVREAVGRVTYAIQLEKNGNTGVEECEEAYSKAAAALHNVLGQDDVQKDNELSYWLKLFLVHVNKHLYEIVVLVDNNKTKPPAHYDKLEQENSNLKDDVEYLKSVIKDLRIELEVHKDALKQNQPIFKLSQLTGTEQNLKEDQFNKMHEDTDRLLERLRQAKQLVTDIKALDESINNLMYDQSTGALREFNQLSNGVEQRHQVLKNNQSV